MTVTSLRRRALLLGCGSFTDRSLAPLRSPGRDVEELGRVLRDAQVGRYTVTADLNCSSRQAQRAIEGFFSAARVTDDMNLLYLSCHGVQDARGRLYFAFTDTERDFLSSTAVSADWVRERIYSSRSKATLVLVDCCFSGSFIKGMQARSSGVANVESLVRDLPEGSGVAVLTASGDTEVSFEDTDSDLVRPSYFTHALVTGIATGDADLNRDGRVTVDELYEYVYDQVAQGPSPQRPRRLGMGEGVLVVSDTIRSRPTFAPALHPVSVPRPEPPPTRLAARGVMGWVSFDGQWVLIVKDGVGHQYKGERRYHVSQLSGVAVKPATRLHHGYLQILVQGVTPAPVARFGPTAGRPPITDEDSISFAKKANDDIRRIQDAVLAAVNTVHGGAEPAPPMVAPRTEGRSLSEPSTAPVESPPPNPATEYRRGETDGAKIAKGLSVAALGGLASHHFDVVQWLRPWREYWARNFGQPQPSTAPLPAWLPDLAQHLGGHAAPAGSTNSTFIPSPAYMAGFCLGLRNTWTNAISSGLIPVDRPSPTGQAAPPPGHLPPVPLAESTLRDLETARNRAHRAAVVRWSLRGLLWLATGLFVLMEMAAIGITIQGGWTDADGEPASNQTPHAIFANLGCLVPLIALVTFAVIDLRRMRRKNTDKPIPDIQNPSSQKPAPDTDSGR